MTAKAKTVKHYDPTQCPPLVNAAYAKEHSHPVCGCDADVDDGNVRFHIRHVLDGHWPLRPDQDVVIDVVCGGGVTKTSTHRAALHNEPLGAKP